MSQLNDEFRQLVIEKLRRGEDLPVEWTRELFPPEKRECELVYHGKEREEDILSRTMAVPLQKVRTFRNGKNGNGWTNMLIFGDNLQVLKNLLQMKDEGKLKNANGTPGVRLIYIDPPFATKKEFRGAQDQKAYQDKIAGTRFLEFLRKRLVFLHELLSDDGSIYVHLDEKKGYQTKLLLDEIFDENKFRNAICWAYTNKLQGNVGQLPAAHEMILWYSKSSSDWVFNKLTEPLKEPVRTNKKIWDKKKQSFTSAKDKKGNTIYVTLTERNITDVWPIPYIAPGSRERVEINYPTQKPESLLKRLVSCLQSWRLSFGLFCWVRNYPCSR